MSGPERQRILEGGAAEPAETDREEAEEAKGTVAKSKKRKGAAPADQGKGEAPAEAKAAKPKGRAGKSKGRKAGEPKEAAGEPKETADKPKATAEPKDAGDAGDKPKGRARRRGAAETTPARKRGSRPAPGVTVKARSKYVRCAPRKARLVVDGIRGKPVEQARAILAHGPRAASVDVLKLLDSCVANAENNHELGADELVVGHAYVDEGPTLKRYRPRALGRATRIRKRTSHLTITLTTSGSEEG